MSPKNPTYQEAPSAASRYQRIDELIELISSNQFHLDNRDKSLKDILHDALQTQAEILRLIRELL